MESQLYTRVCGLLSPQESFLPPLRQTFKPEETDATKPALHLKLSKVPLSNPQSLRGLKNSFLRQIEMENCGRRVLKLKRNLFSLKKHKGNFNGLTEDVDELRTSKVAAAKRNLRRKMRRSAILIQKHVRGMITRKQYADAIYSHKKHFSQDYLLSLDSQMAICKEILGEEIAYDHLHRPYQHSGEIVNQAARKVQQFCKSANFRRKAKQRLALIYKYGRASNKIESIRNKKALIKSMAHFKHLLPRKKTGRHNTVAKAKRTTARKLTKKPTK